MDRRSFLGASDAPAVFRSLSLAFCVGGLGGEDW
ncbi:MAG: hypothetical protein KatS3mg038_3346 [Candidatus Kapaibacterium sp.]|nr:MAG: hypothetical protein KatS3mg038_3346 [Candidatus Kapabacteria bacterium]